MLGGPKKCPAKLARGGPMRLGNGRRPPLPMATSAKNVLGFKSPLGPSNRAGFGGNDGSRRLEEA